MKFEELLKELEEIVKELETGKLSLAESIAKYQRGSAISAELRQLLLDAKKVIEEQTE